jgi:hypothetical protein
MGLSLNWIGEGLARFLAQKRHIHSTAIPTPPAQLLSTLQVGDVLLVEGGSRSSTAIKFLTQSTWSHAALYIGNHFPNGSENAGHCFVEADIVEGVRSVGIDEFAGLHTRICRPVGLDDEARLRVVAYAVARIGHQYDLRNVLDLVRYLLPTPPVPSRFRRQLLALGSGDPTRAICSTLIAQSFQSIHYPILPIVEKRSTDSMDCPGCVEEIYRLRHHSLFTPRDFDVSPYFQIIKPMIEKGFDFKSLKWEETAIRPLR